MLIFLKRNAVRMKRKTCLLFNAEPEEDEHARDFVDVEEEQEDEEDSIMFN